MQRAATYRVQDGGDSPPDGALVLGDPLASQTAFPFSQLPEMGWAEPPEVRDGDGEDGGDGGDEGANNNKLPDFLTDLLDEKDNKKGGQADSKRKGAGKGTPVLMYQLVRPTPKREERVLMAS